VPFVTSWLAVQVVADIFIAGTLITIFCRSRTGFRKTDTLLQRLIRGAIQTSVFAGIFPIGDLVSFAIVPHLNFHGMFSIPIGRIYTNTLMDTLLTREVLRSERSGTYDTGPNGWEAPTTELVDGATRSTNIRLKVQKTIQVTNDHDEHSSKEDINSKVDGMKCFPRLEIDIKNYWDSLRRQRVDVQPTVDRHIVSSLYFSINIGAFSGYDCPPTQLPTYGLLTNDYL